MCDTCGTPSGQAWRQHFSVNAADLLQIYHWFGGVPLKELLMECFKRQARRRATSQKINETTVQKVLQQVNDSLKEQP